MMQHRERVLSSLLAWSVTLLLISSCFGIANAATRHRRSFFDLGCNGVYDKSIFARLDRICEDCYNQIRDLRIHSLCRMECFTSQAFENCLMILQLHEEEDIGPIQEWIRQLRGADANL